MASKFTESPIIWNHAGVKKPGAFTLQMKTRLKKMSLLSGDKTDVSRVSQARSVKRSHQTHWHRSHYEYYLPTESELPEFPQDSSC